MTVSEVAGRVRRRAADRAYAGALVIFPDELALLLSEAGWLGPFPAVVEPVGPKLRAVPKDALPGDLVHDLRTGESWVVPTPRKERLTRREMLKRFWSPKDAA